MKPHEHVPRTGTSAYVYRDEDAPEYDPMKVESMCPWCARNGLTTILCTRIPHYRQVIVMSFQCDHCGNHNSELQSAEPVQEYGTEITLKVEEQEDLRRQVVKSEYAQILIPELMIEVPFKTQPGEVTTVEGILRRVKMGLQQDQARRRLAEIALANRIDAFVDYMDEFAELQHKWTLKINDPSGNCFIESPNPMHVDPRCITTRYYRTLEMNKLLALADDDDEVAKEWRPTAEDMEWKSYEECKNSILHFKSPCPSCGADTEVLMKPTDIPRFQTVIVMSSACDACGHRSNEIKPGGAIQDNGCKLSLRITEALDLSRDVLKSDTCSLEIPEIELEVGYGALSGRFTTIEGLLIASRDQLKAQSAFFFGDSAEGETRAKLEATFTAFDDILALKRSATLVLDDPAGNSYIQSINDDADDPRLTKDFYERTFEQNDDLGINDMKVDNYGELETVAEEEEPAAEAKTSAAIQGESSVAASSSKKNDA